MSDPTPAPPIVDIWIEGHPAPGGSKSAFAIRNRDGTIKMRPGSNIPMIVITDDAKGNKNWKRTVAIECRAQLPGFKPIEGPVKAVFNFWLKRPKAEFSSSGHLKSWAKAHHTSKPDALKLARSTEDALTKIVWVDDAQVVAGTQTKQYCGAQDKEGCRVRVWKL